ncbi:phage tail protein [Klebsiella michiganensis]|uniref:phage tail-collar fiber domain-containing protein n=1 Tax=Klebsiella michiganensis TaxID=1134687 RepID=UPI002065351C|nr:phage tail protein [Klebsiella michiganensis]MDG9983979.1 phage tail protein [Klebsiella michiganensis]MDH0828276.1 phage tail protein [Klebsiella michiganensis]MDH0841278.1 phage tail protein [Klebsiella michiganensis]DAY50640.1 MAG TPA: tail collar fiber protein [Caudoviricetes sp.]
MATGLTLTTAGASEIEAAYQAGEVVDITAVLIGDGGGVTLPTDPDDLAAVTALFGQFGRETFDSDSSYEGFISGQIVINCKDYPGKRLREAGLVSAKGTLIAYGVYPATYLPAQSDSIIKEIILTLVLTLTHTSSVQLVIDPALATLTQETGDKRYLRQAQNLADLNDTEEARENLELGNSATRDVGTTAGTVAAGDDSRITGALQKESNLSDLTDTAEARENLELGNSATRDVGTSEGMVAAGDDSRITGALQKESNLSDLTNAASARENLGLNSDGEGFKGIVDAILYPGIIIPSEKSPAERFPWQTWESLSNAFADRVVRIGSQHGATGGSNKVKIAASNLPPHWHKSGDRSPGETWDPTTTHGTDNQKSGPLNMTAGTYIDAAGEQETANESLDVTNEYVTLCLWKRTA